jgi:glycosyltransferase involved in cell wall biosynthesis
MNLSVITINKDNAEGLKKTCLSVVSQTYKDFEWIIIDGASNDNSVSIIEQYSDRVTYWISEPDSGIYNAMNKGIKHAVGNYLLFLNSGDFLLYPWTLEKAFNEIKTCRQADVYYSDAVEHTHKVIISPENITLKLLISYMINHQNTLIRRELFEHQLYNEKYKIKADWYFFLAEMLQHNISFYKIKTIIAVYDTTGVSSLHEKKSRLERKNALKELKIPLNFIDILIPCIIKIKIIIKYLMPYGLYKLYYDRKHYRK